MKDFRTVTLADQVFERLESDIIQGVYPRGEVLTELRLVEQLNVSRTPIREALRRLEQEHLIADTGKGTVVLGITAEDLVDIMDIRCKIEGLASYYAAKNASPDGLARLQHILDLQEFYFEKRDAEHLREMDDQFHEPRRHQRHARAAAPQDPPLPQGVHRRRQAHGTGGQRAPRHL